MNLRNELDKAINAAAAAEKEREAKAVLASTDDAMRDGSVTREQLLAAIAAHEAVGDFTGAARYKTTLTKIVNDQRI